MPEKCIFCDKERELKSGCQKQKHLVCGDDELFFIESRWVEHGRYICFSENCDYMGNP